jgi:hypothetical protein
MGSGLAFFAAPGLLGGMGLGVAGGLAKVRSVQSSPFLLSFPSFLLRLFDLLGSRYPTGQSTLSLSRKLELG